MIMARNSLIQMLKFSSDLLFRLLPSPLFKEVLRECQLTTRSSEWTKHAQEHNYAIQAKNGQEGGLSKII